MANRSAGLPHSGGLPTPQKGKPTSVISPQLKRLLQELNKSKEFPKTKGREKAKKRRNEEIGESIEEQRRGNFDQMGGCSIGEEKGMWYCLLVLDSMKVDLVYCIQSWEKF
ncbi:hypothetical protein IC582_016117 [Cucumis melo]